MVSNLANGYEKAIVLMAENAKTQTELSKTQTEILSKLSGNIEGMRAEVKDNNNELKLIREKGLKVIIYGFLILSAIALPVNALELIKLIWGGGI